jgi:cell division protease FtsH
MSEKLGPLTFGKREEQIFLGKELTRHKDYSEKTAEEIDDEIRTIVADRYDYAKQLLLDNKPILIKLAEGLLERETLNSAEINKIVEVAQNGGKEPESKGDAGTVTEATA